MLQPASKRRETCSTLLAILVAGWLPTAAAADDPPGPYPSVQWIGDPRAIRVEAPGLPFRDWDHWCDPIEMMNPDPCFAQWGVDNTGDDPPRWGLLPLATAPSPYSACWLDIDKTFRLSCALLGPTDLGIILHDTQGYPLNINLLGSSSIGDFLPPSPVLGGSSVALLPPGAADAPTGWRGLGRPVQAGAVDLITGMPLARVSELELPFGGATFRLVRTRSHSQRVEAYTCAGDPLIDTWWDWAGDGWMISESPLLLIDSAVPDMVGNGPRTTYLILDAHHSIPFQRLDDTGTYEAPARFRARLTHNGRNWNPALADWVDAQGQPTPPTRYTVSLYDGALTYTFLVVRGDVPNNRWDKSYAQIPCGPGDPCVTVSSMHARPFLPQQFGGSQPYWNPRSLAQNPGQGVPYYGLCTRIEDQYGHVVDISFGKQTQFALDNPQTPYPDDPPSADCVECMQDCPGKGQIRSIRLSKRDGESQTVYWTLLYRYRIAPRAPWDDFLYNCPNAYGLFPWERLIPNTFDHFGTRVLDSIFVYRGDEPGVDALPNAGYTVSTTSRLFDGTGMPTVAALDADDTSVPVPSNWLHRVRYHYGFQFDHNSTVGEQEGMLDRFPRLLKISVESRLDTGQTPQTGDPSSVRSWLFEYDNAVRDGGEAWLAAVYDPDAVDRAVAAARADDPTAGVNRVALALDAQARLDSYFVGTLNLDNIRAAATVRWTPGAAAGISDPGLLRGYLPDGRPSYIRTDDPVAEVDFWAQYGDGQAGTLSLSGPSGESRYFRFRRFCAGPEVTLGDGRPHRTAFHVPYAWRGWADDSRLYSTPDYTKPRWITIVDEFADRTAMEYGESLETTGYFLPSYPESKSKLLSRRVVHVGPSGVVLRDHLWRFKDGQLVENSGSGLGAENTYLPVSQFLEDAGMALPDVPPGQPDPDGYGLIMPPIDPFAHLRNELLLMEQRSVGWSVADNAGNGLTDGFVRFYEYEALRFDTDPHNEGDLLPTGEGWYSDYTARVELRAEGVKQGQAYTRIGNGPLQPVEDPARPRLYTRELFRPPNPADPGGLPAGWPQPDDPDQWEYVCEARYLVPTLNADRLQWGQLPAPGSPPPMTTGSRPEPRVALSYSLTKRAPESLDPGEYQPAYSRPVRSTITIGPAQQQRPGGHWYFPVERRQFDDDGKLVWTASGLVRNPIDPSAVPGDALQSLSHTVYVYDADGRTRHIIADIDVQPGGQLPVASVLNVHAGYQRPQDAEVTDAELAPLEAFWPVGWPRMEAADARNYVLTYRYANSDGRLSDIYYPNGRRWASRIVTITADESTGDPLRPRDLVWNEDGFSDYGSLTLLPEERWFAREYIFNEIELRTEDPDGPGGSDPILRSYSRVVGEIRDYRNRAAVGMPAVTRRVFFATASDHHHDLQNAVDLSGFLETPQPPDQPRFMEEQRVEYAVNSAGRLARADLLETGPNGVSVEVGSEEVYDLVDVVRKVSFDGTITRIVRNLLGQPVRRYVGTDDSGWLDHDADLALVERIEYGEGVNDAWLPTTVRRYTSNPSWAGDPFSDPGSSDPDGYATVTSYDWRMRPVRVDEFGETATGNRDPAVAPRLMTTLTYLDHADRPIVVATFGAGELSLPPALDPVTRREWLVPVRPAVADLYSLSLKPISVEETFYGPEGGIVERRTYHYDPNGVGQQLTWHEEHTYTGRGGQEVYEQRPEQPVRVSLLDGLGRTVSSASLATWNGAGWEWELSRADYLLDADGNVCATSRFDRVLGTGATLVADPADGSVNAVRARSVAWYDPQKRPTASALLGSESRGSDGLGPDLMIAGPTAYVRQVNDGNASEPWINDAKVGDPTADPIERAGLPDWARLSINRYSMLTGRLIWTSNPDGTITQFDYDRAGRLARKTENRFADLANGDVSRVTEYEYTLGRLTGIIVSRSPGDPVVGDRQVTRLVYGARLLAYVPPVSNSVPPTYADSGVHLASVVGRMHLPVAATGEPSFTPPDPFPLPHEDPNLDTGEIVLRYTFDGQIAERTDARGVTFRYFYDALGRLAWVVVGSYDGGQFYTKLPSSMLDGPVPVDRIMTIQYLYNDEGRLSDVIARTNADDPNSVLTHTRYEYDARGNLIREWQGHDGHLGATPPATTARVDYEWDYAPTDTPAGALGHDRLAAIIYPRPPNGNEASRRRVNFSYGDPGSIDDTISRLLGITSGYNSAFQSVARFQYAGIDRRAAMTLGAGTGQIHADLRAPVGNSQPIGLSGLDMFGRLRDLHYRNTAKATLFRAEHAYDESGNRLYDRITQWPSPALHNGSAYVLDARSQLHGYDDLHRLTASTVAQVDLTDPGNPVPAAGSVLREDLWWLDVLGNWQPAAGVPPASLNTGRYATGNLDGYAPGAGIAPVGGTSLSGGFIQWKDPNSPLDADPDHLQIAPITNGRNEVTDVLFRTSIVSGWNPKAITIRHDAAGNLVFDGTLIYHYDAWGRLVQVNAGAVNPTGTPVPGRPYADLITGPMLKHYTYDGLGRLVRTQSPYPSPLYASQGNVRSERFYYDGVRRIQEVRLDPAKSLEAALTSEDSQVRALADAALSSIQASVGKATAIETAAAPLLLENQLFGEDGPILEPGPVAAKWSLVREYVWGPGDAWHPATVDELLCYYGEGREAYWPLQDAAGDVVAVCAPGGLAEGYVARVVAQQRYDAYGQVISADHIHPHAFLAVGHKGLFFDRLDCGVSDATAPGTAIPFDSTTPETPRLVPFARGVYHVRNRTMLPAGGSPSQIGQPSMGQPVPGSWKLMPEGLSSGAAVHGRFMQADPNATGMVLMGFVTYHGQAPLPRVDDFALVFRFGDGANLYEHLRSNTALHADPLGLYLIGFDPNTGWLDPELYPNAPLRRPNAPPRRVNPVRTGSAGEIATIMALIGRAGGAILFAHMLGDGVIDNPDLRRTLEGQFRDTLPSLVGGFAGGWLTKNSSSVWKIWTAGGLGAAAGRIGYEALQPGSMDWGGLAMGILGDMAQSGLSFAQGPVAGLTAGIALGVGFYSGAVEYLAESAFTWWRH